MTISKLRTTGALALTLALAGCGGGGGGDDAPTLALQDLQGYWTGSATAGALGDGVSKVRAVVLADGRAWLFLHDGSQSAEPLLGLATATLAPAGTRFTGSGRRYPASGAALASIDLGGTGPSGAAFNVEVGSAAARSALALTYDSAFDRAASPAAVVADWRFTKENGAIEASWQVNGQGTLTGSSTLGCTYGGTVVPYPSSAVYTVSVTEQCSGTRKQLTGIARLNSTGAFLTFGLTTANGEEAEAFVATKAPT